MSSTFGSERPSLLVSSNLCQKDCLTKSVCRKSSKPVEVYGSFLFDVEISTDTVALAFPVLRWLRGEAQDSVCFTPAALLPSCLPGDPKVHSSQLRYRFSPGSKVLASLFQITSPGSEATAWCLNSLHMSHIPPNCLRLLAFHILRAAACAAALRLWDRG